MHLAVDRLEDSYAEDSRVADSPVAGSLAANSHAADSQSAPGGTEQPPADVRVTAPASGRPEAVRWVMSFMIVAACHGAGALALMRNAAIIPEAGVDAPVVMLDLPEALSAAPVLDLPSGPLMDEDPPTPQPKEETRPPEIEAEETPPKLELEPPRPPEPPAEVALPMPEPEPPRPEPKPPAEGMHAPAPARTPPRVARWQGQLGAHIDRFTRYPAGTRHGGTAWVAFTIDRLGRLLQSSVVRSAGAPALDHEALATLARAAPMPPPPDEVSDAELTVTMPVHFEDR